MYQTTERVWPSRVGLALSYLLWFLAAQIAPAFRVGAEIDWNRGILRTSSVLVVLSLAFALASFTRLNTPGRVGAVLAALLALFMGYQVMTRWVQL